jgi:hypothetical protein
VPVVLYALASGEGVVAHSGANARHFVGRDAHANAVAADQDASLEVTLGHRFGHGPGEVGIVGRLSVVGSKVVILMA